MDICQLILDDHAEQRRLFGLIEQIDPDNTDALSAVWTRLAAFLDAHAEAEERHFYPDLLKKGEGANDADDGTVEGETEDAIEAHNKLRDAVKAVEKHKVGSKAWIDAEGALKRHRFCRGLMRSARRLTYEEVQAAADGTPDAATAALAEDFIAPLYGAYTALDKARRQRGVLELDLPERRIVLDDAGAVLASGPEAVAKAKKLIADVASKPIDGALIDETARRIAEIRRGNEGREGVGAFLEKRRPNWRGD